MYLKVLVSDSPFLPTCRILHRKVVQELSQSLLNEHEILTLARHYGERHYPVLTTLVHLIQDTLQKANYIRFPQLLAAMEAVDDSQGGFLKKDSIRQVCLTQDLPLSDQLIDGIMMK